MRTFLMLLAGGLLYLGCRTLTPDHTEALVASLLIGTSVHLIAWDFERKP